MAAIEDLAQATATALSAYVPGTRAWFPDRDLGWISATLTSKPTISASGEVTMEFQLDEGDGIGAVKVVKSSLEKLRGRGVDEQLPPLRNPPLLEGTDDLTSLSYLNEPAVLHAILSRYSQRSIYTYSGIVLIAVNPFSSLNLYGPELIQSYSGKRRGELEPHLFAIAEDAYRCMIQDEKDQTIVVSGESGAGKTVSAKYIMRYFATVEDPNRPRSRKTIAGGGSAAAAAAKENGGMNETEQQILATNPIMEAFGNAKTIRNDNSSRFGKYIEILFDRNHDIVGAKIRTYLLERSRLVYQPENERNYHIFYQLCAGAPTTERKELGLSDASDFAYLNQGKSITIAGVNDGEDFKETQKALSTVGLTVERQWSIFRLLAALLHLGNVQIGATRTDAIIAQDDASLFMATKLLGIDINEFRKWAVKKQIVTRGEKIVSNLTQAQAIVVRDSVSKYVYSSLFDWLVDQLNHSLALESTATRTSMIGVLDIYGFERFKVNSFEQFCINYANERLQHEFNRHVFKLEQDEYIAEEISWTFIDFSDNQPTIDMIEGRLGILSLLDEESRLPSGSDASFLQKLYTQLEKKPEFKNSFQRPRFGQSAFTVCHYALDVTYEAEGFLEKNRDAVPDEHLALLSATTNPFLKEVLETAAHLAQTAKEQPVGPGSAVGPDGEVKAVGPRRPMGGIVKKPTLGSQFKASLVSLMATIDATNAHYIRCIKPNEAKKAWEVEPQNVLGQLRACGVLETIRISTAGYPSRRTFADFAERYYMLVPSAHWDMTSLDKAKELAAYILKTTITDSDKYQIGLNKIFFRAGILAHFEQLRGERLKVLVVLIQKNLRRNVEMKRYGNLKASTIKLQSWWRMCAAQRHVDALRRERAATLLQTGIRRLLAQQRFTSTVAAIVRIQSLVRGRAQRANFATTRTQFAAVTLQSLFRGILVRRKYAQDRKGVVLLQSCYRRRLAKKELVHLRNEAKTASHYKQVTYKLENKVVELTQNLQKRTKENKDLVAKVKALEVSILEWQGKHDQVHAKSRELQTQLDEPTVPLKEFEDLIAGKQALEKQLDQSLTRVKEHESRIAALEEEVRKGAEELEARESALMKRDGEDSTTATALRAEVAKLKEELHRASTLAQLSGNGDAINNVNRNAGTKATNPDFPQLYDLTMGKEAAPSTAGSRRAQRPRSAELVGAGIVKKAQAAANRHVSVMPPQAPMVKDEDAVAEEIENLLLDEAQLDEDLLQGLIQRLRTPMGDISPKECLFPSHLIALVLNEYWLRSMIRPSERVLANVMQTIQGHIMALEGDELITQAIYWISNVHELLSFVSVAESDLLAGIAPGDNDQAFGDYERLIVLAKHDLESLEYNIYHTLIDNTKRRLHKMVVPAVIESQSLPGFVENSGGRLFNRLMSSTNTPAYTMDDVLNVLNTVWRALKMYYLEASVVHQVITELMRLINSTAFNDLVLRRSFCSWKRAMQIQYNITRIEEWCKAKGIPEAMLQLEHLSQSVKLLQLKKSTLTDIDIIYDVSWVLTPSQIHKLISQYHTAEYENPISPEILKAAAARVTPNDRNDHLLLPPEVDEAGPYELPLPREVTGIETYIPAFIQAPSLRTLASLVT